MKKLLLTLITVVSLCAAASAVCDGYGGGYHQRHGYHRDDTTRHIDSSNHPDSYHDEYDDEY